MIKQITFFIAFLASYYGYAQDAQVIRLQNPSFEGLPTLSRGPSGWVDCGFPNESAPDVHPVSNSEFNVLQSAYDGDTYLGMVVRDNDTWEAVSQYLRQPLKAGQCYRFAVHLCISGMYMSRSRVTDEQANYNTPATLRLWAGNGACDKRELLYVTRVITHTRWIEYEMILQPKRDYRYITLEAFYRTPQLFPYNGNILLDNAKNIEPIPCDEEFEPEAETDEEIPGDIALVPLEREEPSPQVKTAPTSSKPQPKEEVVVTKPVETRPQPKEEVVRTKPTSPTSSKPQPKEEVILPTTNETGLADVDASTLAAGTTIQLKKLYFEADKSDVKKDSYSILNEVYAFLHKNKKVIIEVGGHTNNKPIAFYCDSLSTARAQSVAEYLMEKGIDEERVKYKGYGKRNPIVSNKTHEGRRRNQRVEIRILGFKS